MAKSSSYATQRDNDCYVGSHLVRRRPLPQDGGSIQRCENERMQPSNVQVRVATSADLDLIVPLFDAYRRFYRQPSDLPNARSFLQERLDRLESTILVALDQSEAIGFTQLYPSFSSVSMARIFILNDLFVSPEARGKGVGSALLAAAAEFGRQAGAVRLVLGTETTNTVAQSVYERMGWVKDTSFYTYELTL